MRLKKKKFNFKIVLSLFAFVVLAISGIFLFKPSKHENKADEEPTSPFVTIGELYDGNNNFNKLNVANLLSCITGDNIYQGIISETVSDSDIDTCLEYISSYINVNDNSYGIVDSSVIRNVEYEDSKQFGQDVSVTLGGLKWNVVALTKDDEYGNAILTLMLSSHIQSSAWGTTATYYRYGKVSNSDSNPICFTSDKGGLYSKYASRYSDGQFQETDMYLYNYTLGNYHLNEFTSDARYDESLIFKDFTITKGEAQGLGLQEDDVSDLAEYIVPQYVVSNIDKTYTTEQYNVGVFRYTSKGTTYNLDLDVVDKAPDGSKLWIPNLTQLGYNNNYYYVGPPTNGAWRLSQRQLHEYESEKDARLSFNTDITSPKTIATDYFVDSFTDITSAYLTYYNYDLSSGGVYGVQENKDDLYSKRVKGYYVPNEEGYGGSYMPFYTDLWLEHLPGNTKTYCAVRPCLYFNLSSALNTFKEDAGGGDKNSTWLDNDFWNLDSYRNIGDGSVYYPFEISTAEQLANICGEAYYFSNEFEGLHFKQTANIDLSAHLWSPICDYDYNGNLLAFKGKFDGNGYTIKGMRIDKLNRRTQGDAYLGLFGRVSRYYYDDDGEPQLRNITVKDGHIYSVVRGYAGGIVGYAEDVWIYKCNNYINIEFMPYSNVNGLSYAGGIVGEMQAGQWQLFEESSSHAHIERCNNYGDIAARFVGGIVGSLKSILYNYDYFEHWRDDFLDEETGSTEYRTFFKLSYISDISVKYCISQSDLRKIRSSSGNRFDYDYDEDAIYDYNFDSRTHGAIGGICGVAKCADMLWLDSPDYFDDWVLYDKNGDPCEFDLYGNSNYDDYYKRYIYKIPSLVTIMSCISYDSIYSDDGLTRFVGGILGEYEKPIRTKIIDSVKEERVYDYEISDYFDIELNGNDYFEKDGVYGCMFKGYFDTSDGYFYDDSLGEWFRGSYDLIYLVGNDGLLTTDSLINILSRTIVYNKYYTYGSSFNKYWVYIPEIDSSTPIHRDLFWIATGAPEYPLYSYTLEDGSVLRGLSLISLLDQLGYYYMGGIWYE